MNEGSVNDFNQFYHDWANRPPEERDFDIETCVEKSGAALDLMAAHDFGQINSVLEVGCGFGRNLSEIAKRTHATYALGCDVSAGAIAFASKHYANAVTRYILTPSLNINETVKQIRSLRSRPFDLLVLFDVLEHVPNPKTIVRELAPLTKYFLIKLPLENSVFDNYLLPRNKQYPSAVHPDGHLREFHVNDVHAFLVSLGLIPLAYDFYKYKHSLLFPRFARPKHVTGRIYFEAQKMIKLIMRCLLPKRIFLRLIGGGGFVCVATWSKEAVFE